MASAPTASSATKGGDGLHSYTQNSQFQREGVKQALLLINDTISESLDLEQIISSSPSKVFTVADLGCSVGPNSVIAVENIIHSVKLKHQSNGGGYDQEDIEFQAFFNDLVSNDFNTLFKSLPPDRQYFAAGVPGRFHGRLFPQASLHFVHSSYALHWLRNAPNELTDKNSPAFNKGRVYYNKSPKEVGEAYSAQFAKDMESFLAARAEEMVVGGLMALVLVCLPDNVHSQPPVSRAADLLEAVLLDMANEGILSEDKIDSFNVPKYNPTQKELEGLVMKNAYFSIERMERLVPSETKVEMASDSKVVISHLRAVWEGVLEDHFGVQIIEEVFDRLLKKVMEFSPLYKKTKLGHLSEYFVILKRNMC